LYSRKEEEVYLSVGSNLNDRLNYIKSAIKELNKREGIKVEFLSPIYETSPVDVDYKQPYFLNCIIKLKTNLSPYKLLATIEEIERLYKRENKNKKLPRTLDLDILLYGKRRLKGPKLIIPHPRIKKRKFCILGLLALGVEKLPDDSITLKKALKEIDKSQRCYIFKI
jgi:2-amino-4-hydroxy-6-hydroxymethyldihydropteridine diphosphokinase